MDILLGVVVAVGLVLLIGLAMYNGMVRGRNMVDESWSGVDVQLKRRHDLIPNLIATVEGYASHESATFEALTRARVDAQQATNAAQATPAEAAVTSGLGKLFAVAEAYPDLKASENFLDLQRQLANIETQIAAARRIFNGNVTAYKSKIQSFPGVLIAKPFGFTDREFFHGDAADKIPTTVSFA